MCEPVERKAVVHSLAPARRGETQPAFGYFQKALYCRATACIYNNGQGGCRSLESHEIGDDGRCKHFKV